MDERDIREFKEILEDGFKKVAAAMLTVAYYQANYHFIEQKVDYSEVFEIYRYYMTRI